MTEKRLARDSSRDLVEYEWGDRGRRFSDLPVNSDVAPLDFPRGEAPRVRDTVFYLSANADLFPEVGAPSARQVGPAFEPTSEGRFAGALRSPGGRTWLEYSLSEGVQTSFSLSFWIRPESPGRVLTIPDIMRLRLDRRMRPVVEVFGSGVLPTRRRIPVELKPSEWTRVGFTLRAREFKDAIVLVGDELFEMPELRGNGPWSKVLRIGSGPSGLAAFRGGLDDVRIVRRALSSAELLALGNDAPNTPEERLEVHSNTGVRSFPEIWIDPIRVPRVENASDWRRGLRSHLAASDDGLIWTEGQWRRAASAIDPGARTGSAISLVGDKTALLFSGSARDSHVGPTRCIPDTWLYDIGASRWRPRPAIAGPSGRTAAQIASNASAPNRQDAVTLLYGGIASPDPSGPRLRDTWLFHTAAQSWSKGPAHPANPSSTRALVYDSRRNAFVMLHANAVSELNLERGTWSKPEPASVEFVGSSGSANSDSWSLPTGVVAAFDPVSGDVVSVGGAPLAQTVHYSASDSAFRVHATDLLPRGAAQPGFAYQATRRRFVYCTSSEIDKGPPRADLWSYEPAARRWSKVNAADAPDVVGDAGLVWSAVRDEFVWLCGTDAAGNAHSEAYHLRLDPKARATARYVFDRDAFLDHQGFDMRWVHSKEITVELRFRSSADGAEWSAWGPTPEAWGTERFVQLELTSRGTGPGRTLRILSMGFTPSAQKAPAPNIGRAFDLGAER